MNSTRMYDEDVGMGRLYVIYDLNSTHLKRERGDGLETGWLACSVFAANCRDQSELRGTRRLRHSAASLSSQSPFEIINLFIQER